MGTGNSCSQYGQIQEREVKDDEKQVNHYDGGRCSPVPRHVQCVSRLLLGFVGNLGLNVLCSQTAVDLDAGNRNADKRDNSARNDAYIPQLKACDGCKNKEDGKSPDEGEHCANSPGRHNLLILEVKKQGGVSVQTYRC